MELINGPTESNTLLGERRANTRYRIAMEVNWKLLDRGNLYASAEMSALIDGGGAGSEVVGHILFFDAVIATGDAIIPATALPPMAVAPRF